MLQLRSMQESFATSVLWWSAILLAVIGSVLIVQALARLGRRRPLGGLFRLMFALVFLSAGFVFGAVALGIQGYRALTHEATAASVWTEPTGPKRFHARFRFPDGREANYELAGDELYVDAHILKWHPYANILGLHTAYELDRVAGRYQNLALERNQSRTVYSLSQERSVDLFDLRRRYVLLSPVLDAEYGSASFVAADVPAQYELKVSTSGLLLRRVEPASRK
jgi:hypothetical protein